MPVNADWLRAQADDDQAILASLHQGFVTSAPDRVAVAVSGGGDSMALLHALYRYTQKSGQTLLAVTVNHGLRPQAADEARFVGDFCAGLEIPHRILHWTRKTDTGNLQDQARQARYTLMARWASECNVGSVALGHTATDQAETFLMRLARESGIDGLSGMRQDWIQTGVRFHRPLLCHTRQQLRNYLSRHDIQWVDDPSNDDVRYDRIKARKTLDALRPLGISAETLGAVSQHLSKERQVIEQAVKNAARRIATTDRGDVLFDETEFRLCLPELARRLLVQALMWVSSGPYPPRTQSVDRVLRSIGDKNPSTLAGCRITASENTIRISREFQAVHQMSAPTEKNWDGRWRLDGPHDSSFSIRPLGSNGLQQCPDWKAQGLPRSSLLSSPAIWQDDRLIAAPLAGLGNGWTAQIVADFLEHAFAH